MPEGPIDLIGLGPLWALALELGEQELKIPIPEWDGHTTVNGAETLWGKPLSSRRKSQVRHRYNSGEKKRTLAVEDRCLYNRWSLGISMLEY